MRILLNNSNTYLNLQGFEKEEEQPITRNIANGGCSGSLKGFAPHQVV
jgi:hypothetical protein